MVSIKIRHFSITFYPNLVPAIFGEIIQASDIESEFAALGEFTHQQSSGKHLLLGNIRCHVGDERIDIVDAILDEPED